MKLEIPKIIIRPNEQWKLVCTNGTSSYYISNYGRVKADTNKGISILKTQIANGYERVHILSKMYFIHRLVALHFVKNENKDKYIDAVTKADATLDYSDLYGLCKTINKKKNVVKKSNNK